MPSLFRTFRRAAIALLSAAPASAQLSGGMKGGIGQSIYTGDHEFAWKTTGPNTTLFVNWDGGGRVSQQFEIGESRRLGVSTTGGSQLTFSATYLDILLASKFTSPKLLGTQAFLLAGPRLVYGVSCNLEFITGGLTSNTSCDESAGANRLDVGAAVAGGLSWSILGSTIGIEARGATSFRSVVVPLATQNSRSLAWTVLAGVAVPMQFRRSPGPLGGPAMPGVTGLPPLEPLRSVVITESVPIGAPELAQSSGVGASTKRITVTALDADVRSLLIALAKEAGISLVVSNDVRRRVSVSFKDASPEEAIRAIIAEAGLTVVDPPSSRPLPTVVFYQLPVNADDAPAATIAARFGLSAELAQWIVDSRQRP
jgi:hypothetical protein